MPLHILPVQASSGLGSNNLIIPIAFSSVSYTDPASLTSFGVYNELSHTDIQLSPRTTDT